MSTNFTTWAFEKQAAAFESEPLAHVAKHTVSECKYRQDFVKRKIFARFFGKNPIFVLSDSGPRGCIPARPTALGVRPAQSPPADPLRPQAMPNAGNRLTETDT